MTSLAKNNMLPKEQIYITALTYFVELIINSMDRKNIYQLSTRILIYLFNAFDSNYHTKLITTLNGMGN